MDCTLQCLCGAQKSMLLCWHDSLTSQSELWLCLVQVQVVHGQYRGIKLKCIDTPGLSMSGSTLTRNAGVLHAIRKAMNKHKPNLVLYVDRNDVVSCGHDMC